MFLVHDFFIKSVELYADKVALVFGDQKMTYRELDDLSNQIANRLRSYNIKTHDIVGICKARSFHMIASIIAVMKVGASYLPLDPMYPKDRLKYMLLNARVNKIIIDKNLMSTFEDISEQNFILTDDLIENTYFNSETIADLCYVIYTSGSTGNPKGVAMGHRPLVNLIKWQNKETELNDNAITLQFTPISFDVHFQEIFGTLAIGGTLVLITEELRLNTLKLINELNEKKVNRLYLPFVALNHIAECATKYQNFPNFLKEVTTAGEQLKITDHIRSLFKHLSSCKLFNHYGPSETHVVTSKMLFGNVEEWPDLPSIGSEIENCKIRLLDSSLNSVNDGDVGELFIYGEVLANGYLNSDDLTKEKFIETQFGRAYKTGDLGRRVEQEIEFLGRSDSQVKIRGYRIELSEIEIQVSRLISGKKVFARAITEIGLDPYVCIYLLRNDNINSEKLKSELKTILPDYMIPRSIVFIDEVPLTPSGKVDYKKLLVPKLQRPDLINEYVKASDEVEEKLVLIWRDLLKFDEIGILDSFFDLGGNSLSAIKMLIELNQQFKAELTITDIFSLRTIRQISDKLKNVNIEEDDVLNNGSVQVNEKIAIVAMTCRLPGANNIDEFWNNLEYVKNSIEIFNKNETSNFVSKEKRENKNYVFCKAEMPGFDYFDHRFFEITPKEADAMDPQQRKFLELCYEVLELSSISPQKYKGAIGIFAGMGNSKYSSLVDSNYELKESLGDFNLMLGLEKDYIATKTAYKLNLNGPAISVHTACSTSLVAIIEAVNHLRLRSCDVAIAGGISISGIKNQGHLYSEGGILTKDGTCRPYDSNATGTVFSDGAGVIVLKRLSDAIKDNDNVLAVVSGVGINNDGSDKSSFTAPSVNGQRKAILRAMADANVRAEEIGMIEGHGTATPLGDPIEVEALTQAFRKSSKNTKFCHLTSLKSNIGHLTAAAGVASVIKAVLSLKNKKIPGTCHFKNYNNYINFNITPFIVSNQTIEFKENINNKRVAGVSSFGVGGTNAHIILEEYCHNIPKEEKDKFHLIKISAKTKEGLERQRNSVLKFIKENPSDTGKLAYNLDVGRNEYQFKNCILANSSKSDDIDIIESEEKLMSTIVWGFAGQGSHYPNMGKGLYFKNEIFKMHLDLIADKILKKSTVNIKEIMWSEKSHDLLSDTKNSQPAIFALELALARTYMHLGIRPHYLIGHSIGEFAAAVIAGIIEEDSAICLIVERARLMQKLETGKMLTSNISFMAANDICQMFDVDIAAINSSNAVVLSGEKQKIDEVRKYLEKLGQASLELKTSHAFHSKMMNPILKDFEVALDKVKLQKPTIEIIKTSKTQYHMWQKEYWIDHIVDTVDFYQAQRELELIKSAIFIEIGTKDTLINYLKKNKKLEIKYVMSLGRSSELESRQFLKTIGKLWCSTKLIKSFEWNYRESEKFKIPTPTYVFEKNYHWIDSKIRKEEVMNADQTVWLKRKLSEIFERTSGIEITEADYSTSFLELGMDSLFLTQISLQLKKDLNVEIGFRQLLENFESIDALSLHLKDKVKVEENDVVEKKEFVDKKENIIENTKNEMVFSTLNNSENHERKMQTPLIKHSNVSASNVVDIISKQLDLMQQQIYLLSGNNLEISTTNTSHLSSFKNQLATNVEHNKKEEKQTEEMRRGADIKKSKDSFGAQAKIIVEKTLIMKDENAILVKSFCDRYIQKTKTSKQFAQDNRINHADPRVVTGFKPESKELVYPIVVKKSYLQQLWDLDDNKYIDMTCGFGSNFFGNGNERIKKYVLRQIEEGTELGPQHPLVSDVSKMINELTGNERTAFCNTGSEAVLGAMRIARTVTGREKIVVFSGSYHGINDEVIIRGSKNLTSRPAAPGINFNAVSNMIVLDYGTDESLEYIRKHSSELAAVLVEPVQSRRSDFWPKEFLKEIRKITLESKTCLIFDEIITGFRIHPAGAQGHFEIRADLCTYGKIVGGGMPIGVISGKAEYMDALDGGFWQYGDDSTPTVGVTYFAGTFVRHPLALAAAKGALEIIREGGLNLYNQLNERAQYFADEINKMLKENKIPIKLDNFGSLMKPKWTADVQGGDLFFAALRFNGVHVYDGFPWFVNLAHTEEDLNQVLISFQKSIRMMQESRIFESNIEKIETDLGMDKIVSHGPPVIGAKLGKDENGNPAWFVIDPNKPGSYLKVK